GAGAAFRAKCAAMLLDVLGLTGELGWMPAREAGKWQILRPGSCGYGLHAVDVGPAQQPVDLQLGCDARRIKGGFGRGGDNFHVDGRAGIANCRGQGAESFWRNTDVLEADMSQLQRSDQIE